MANIAQLQKAIDNKALDTSTLNRDQLVALDKAFKNGTLKGYPNINAMRIEQGAAADTLAKEKEEQLRPFEAATGLKRLDFELIGDVGGSLMPYIADKNKIAEAFRASGGRPNWGLVRMGGQAYKMGNIASKIMIRTPAGKAVGLLGRTAAVWNRVARGVDKAVQQVKYGLGMKGGQMFQGPSQLLQTELKSQAMGIAGAGAGSVTYGIAEALTDQGGATHEDLARVSENEIDKLSPVDQEVVHASRAMSNAMLFNAGGFLLMPLLGGVGRWAQGILGLKGKQAEIIASNAYKHGYDINLSAVMDNNRGAFASFIRQFNKSVGVFPWISAPRLKHRKALEVQFYNNYLDNINATIPLSHGQLLSLGSLSQMRKNFKETFDVVSANYEKVVDVANHHGLKGLRLVPTEKLGNMVDEVMEQLKVQYPGSGVEGMTTRIGTQAPITEFDDPLIQFLKEIRNLTESGSHITAEQFIGLQKMLTKVLPSTKIHDPRGFAQSLRTAMEKDWASIGKDADLLRIKGVKEAHDSILAQQGTQAGGAYLRQIAEGVNEIQKAQLAANAFFHKVIMPYQGPTAKKMMRTDQEIFTNLGLLGITKQGPILPDEIWEKTIKTVFRSKSPLAIENLKTLLGYGRTNTGTQMFDQFRELYIFDAFKSSFKYKPKNLEPESLYHYLEQAKNSGVINRRYIDELNDEFTSDTFLKGIDPTKLIESGLGTRPFKSLKVGANEVQEFDVEQFAKTLGLSGADTEVAAAKSKIIQMYGGGEAGKKSLHHLETMINIMRRETEVGIADPSVFVQRKLTLGAAGGMSLGQGVARGTMMLGAFGNLPVTLALVYLGRSISSALGSPTLLRKTYDLFTDMERIERRIGGESINSMLFNPTTEGGRIFRKNFAQWLNAINAEDKDFPRVNPNKIDFKEITEYLQNAPIKVPKPKWNKNALIPSVKNRSYYYEDQLQKASTTSLAAGDNFLLGVRKGLENNMMAAQADNSGVPPPGAEGQPGEGQPAEGQAAEGQAAAANPMGGSFAQNPQAKANMQANSRANKYQALWPQDALGQGIAQKNV